MRIPLGTSQIVCVLRKSMRGTLILPFSYIYLIRQQPTQSCLGGNGGSIHVVRGGAGTSRSWMWLVARYPLPLSRTALQRRDQKWLSPRGYLGRGFPTMAPSGDLMGTAEDVADQVRTSPTPSLNGLARYFFREWATVRGTVPSFLRVGGSGCITPISLTLPIASCPPGDWRAAVCHACRQRGWERCRRFLCVG